MDSTIVHHHEKPPCGDFFFATTKQANLSISSCVSNGWVRKNPRENPWMSCPGVFGGGCFSCLRQLQNQLHGEHINTPVNERSWLENGPFEGAIPTRKKGTFSHCHVTLLKGSQEFQLAIFNFHHCWSEEFQLVVNPQGLYDVQYRGIYGCFQK